MENNPRFLFLELGSVVESDGSTKKAAALLQAKVKGKGHQVSMLTYMLKKSKVDLRVVMKVIENLLDELHTEQARDDAHKAQCNVDLERTATEEADVTDTVARLKAFIAAEE